eukprot:s486_g10.t1
MWDISFSEPSVRCRGISSWPRASCGPYMAPATAPRWRAVGTYKGETSFVPSSKESSNSSTTTEPGLECKTGPSCGYTWYECICISREAAAENAAGAKTARIAFGAAAAGHLTRR